MQPIIRARKTSANVVLCLLLLIASSATLSDTNRTNELWDFGVAKQRVEALKKVSDRMGAMAKEPLPKGLSAGDRTDGFAYQQWLRNTARKLHHLSRGWNVLLRRVPKSRPGNNAQIERMQEMNRSFSVQYLNMLATVKKEIAGFDWGSPVLRERQQRAMGLLDTLQ